VFENKLRKCEIKHLFGLFVWDW